MDYAIVVAAGSGTRMQSEIPKQFLLLGGRPVLWYAVSSF
ncbi:MAG: 2-C-methyl-D-erythritol 4-phosphate cytidylyltransferase [Bacteroidota bacterium]|nr:MAG: 2-C-methyl-D-erythritol 4-phosphate cytidylyltransferase [Bacteroidota bacterium]